jgi:hypothetical protein
VRRPSRDPSKCVVRPADAARQAAFAHHLVDGIVELTTWCKHPAFEEEQEWRIIYLRNNDRNPLPVRHRAARGLIIPYGELEMPKGTGRFAKYLPLAEIDCGPSPAPELKQEGVRSLLKSWQVPGTGNTNESQLCHCPATVRPLGCSVRAACDIVGVSSDLGEHVEPAGRLRGPGLGRTAGRDDHRGHHDHHLMTVHVGGRLDIRS